MNLKARVIGRTLQTPRTERIGLRHREVPRLRVSAGVHPCFSRTRWGEAPAAPGHGRGDDGSAGASPYRTEIHGEVRWPPRLSRSLKHHARPPSPIGSVHRVLTYIKGYFITLLIT